MLSAAQISSIERIVASEAGVRRTLITGLASSEELQQLAIIYNWDDGFDLPAAIADHPACDLGVALTLFWLAEAVVWWTRDFPPSEYNRDWQSFCESISQRILDGRYATGETSFRFPMSRVQLYKLQKLNMPDVFLKDVTGIHDAPEL